MKYNKFKLYTFFRLSSCVGFYCPSWLCRVELKDNKTWGKNMMVYYFAVIYFGVLMICIYFWKCLLLSHLDCSYCFGFVFLLFLSFVLLWFELNQVSIFFFLFRSFFSLFSLFIAFFCFWSLGVSLFPSFSLLYFFSPAL